MAVGTVQRHAAACGRRVGDVWAVCSCVRAALLRRSSLQTASSTLNKSNSASMVSPSFFYVPHKIRLFSLLPNEQFALGLQLWRLEKRLCVHHLAAEDGCNRSCRLTTL